MKTDIISIQKKLGVKADGIIGPQTLAAIKSELGIKSCPHWPSQAEVRSGKSMFGKAGDESALRSILPPYPLLYEGKEVKSIRVHHLIARHVQEALQEALAHYGHAELCRLGLNLYGGSYNYRSTSGGGALSMHAWGIALDFSPAANSYKLGAPRASLSHPDCRAWWEIWEQHGAVSLGRARNYDWMHLQFATL